MPMLLYNPKPRAGCAVDLWPHFSLEEDRSALPELTSFHWMGRSALLCSGQGCSSVRYCWLAWLSGSPGESKLLILEYSTQFQRFASPPNCSHNLPWIHVRKQKSSPWHPRINPTLGTGLHADSCSLTVTAGLWCSPGEHQQTRRKPVPPTSDKVTLRPW